MNANKYKPHVCVIPEDDANRQLVAGFLLHPAVDLRAVALREPAGGWSPTLKIFEKEYVPYLRSYQNAHVIMVMDFDDEEGRRDRYEQVVPHDLRERVFIVGSKDTPEALRQALGMSLERLGRELAADSLPDDCGPNWGHEHLIHNRGELQRMSPIIRPILFLQWWIACVASL